MITYEDILLEMQMRRNTLEAEAQRERWTRLAAAGRSRDKRELGIRRMAIRLSDLVAGFRCQLQSRFASEPTAAAC